MKNLKHLSFEPENSFRTDYHNIICSKSFRRLLNKTQVFSVSTNPLISNRMTHSIECYLLAEIIVKMLGLNHYLSSTIGIGHDIGHAPFGHLGERMITKLSGQKFRHEIFGVILLEDIENFGLGLNLSREILKGINNHSRGSDNLTIDQNLPLEFSVVVLADKISYLFSDIEDCLKVGFLNKRNLPSYYFKLGENKKQRIYNCLKAIQKESLECGMIKFQDTPEAILFEKMKKWMYENVYFIIDEQLQRKEMEIAMEKAWGKITKFCEQKPELSPVFITAIMTDMEIFQLASNKKEINELNCFENISYCKKQPYQKQLASIKR